MRSCPSYVIVRIRARAHGVRRHVLVPLRIEGEGFEGGIVDGPGLLRNVAVHVMDVHVENAHGVRGHGSRRRRGWDVSDAG
jgi:hypothetical protein